MKVLHGKKITRPVVSIGEVLKSDKEGIFVVQGKVFDYESRATRNGNFVNSGVILGTDQRAIRFHANWTDNPIDIENGMYIVVEGALKNDKYTNFDWSVEATNLVKIEVAEKVKSDEAPEKRVELAFHSEMSRMSGVNSADEIMKRVKEYGHTHVAITDYENIQVYPSAYAAAKKHGINLIFGVKMHLAEEGKQFVYHVNSKKLKDVTLIGFDVETTGLSVNYRSLTEIGATKVKNGVITRFQCFVKPDEPIPPFITNLTGITNEMVEEQGLPLEEALRKFAEFIDDENVVFIAHNAPFDRDWMIVSFEKVGLKFPNYPIIDTLPLARFLRPNAKSNRLNAVAKDYSKQVDEELKNKKKLIDEFKKIITVLTEQENKVLSQEEEQLALLVEQQSTSEENTNEELQLQLDTLSEKFQVELKLDKEFLSNLIKNYEQRIEVLNVQANQLHLENHHRANEDAEVTVHVFRKMLEEEAFQRCETLEDLNGLLPSDVYKHEFTKQVTILVKNKVGLKNLYKLITKSHIDYLHRATPMIVKSELEKHREGLLIGSGSYLGPLFELVDKKPIEQAFEDAKFYDYIEIEPAEIAEHQIIEGSLASLEEVERTWHKIYKIGKKLNKPIVGVGHVQYLDETHYMDHNILLYNLTPHNSTPYDRRLGRKGFERRNRYFRTTEEMLNSFPYLTDEERKEIVVTNTKLIAEQCEMLSPVPDKLYPPHIEGANEELENLAYETAKSIYGSPLPEIVQARLDKELKSILGYGFGVIYLISQKLVKNSNDNGYLVGSRGSVGSSFVATMTGITEVNPLKPHYVSNKANWNVFFDHEDIPSGYDLPTSFDVLLDETKYSASCIEHVVSKMSESLGKTEEETIELMKNHKPNTCPITGEEGLVRDGQDIPFETFLGFKGDKVPDIDLNFSGEYQTKSHKYVEELFGEKYVFRAGTIGTVADKMAYGYAKGYAEENDYDWTNAEIAIMKNRLQGTKRTSGQHPGGILVVPNDMESEDFTPIQHPANNPNEGIRTSHFDFHSIHDNILKLDILGHDDPTILRRLFEMTGVDPKTVAPNDEKALMLFSNPSEALGINMDDITAETGTLGVPEFGTPFVRQMIMDTKPTTFAELVKISGLSHGTDVWLGNAKDLIAEGICTLKSVIDTRDNIMVYLMQRGLEPSLAFKIMEVVRKGKAASEKPDDREQWLKFEEEMRKCDVPEWYIESCKKIKYMFPKAHAAAYVLSAMRIANYKVYYPKEYYAAILSVRAPLESVLELNQEPSKLRQRIAEMDAEINQLKNNGEKNKAGRIDDTKTAMELVLEAKVRGVKFGNISLEKSEGSRYIIDEDGVIIPPFSSIPGLGENGANKLAEERNTRPFDSVEDLRSRGKASNTNISVLRELGCLTHIEDIQCTFF